MKIVLVNKYWYIKGGTERAIFLTKEILEAQGHTVEVFGMKDERNVFENKYFVEKIDYTKMNLLSKFAHLKKMFWNQDALTKFSALLDDFEPDIVHFHNIYHQLSFSLIEACEKRTIPTVMTLHDYKMLSPNYTLFHHGKIDVSMLGGKYYRCLLNNAMESWSESIVATAEAYFRDSRHIHERISHFIAPSVFMKSLCLKAGWNEDFVSVLHNPIEASSLPQVREQEYVAYTGRLSKEKGVDHLILAAQKTPHIQYKIAGNGEEEASLKKMTENLGLKNVEFVGWLEGEELYRFIAEARLLVVPSLWYENYPYSILRPMQFGKIVIGSNLGGIPELLPKNCLFDPKNIPELVDRIVSWYNAPQEEREKMGHEFQKKIQSENNIASYGNHLLSLYSSLLSP